MFAGQISWQARQVVQDQRTSSRDRFDRGSPPGLVKAASPICWTTFMGESGLSVPQAGQRSWQRLQEVQASASKMSFQVRSVTCAAPNCSAPSSSRSMVAMLPLGARSVKR